MRIKITNILRSLIRFFKKLLGTVYSKEVSIKLVKETDMGLIYEVQLPIVVSSDVVKRVLKVVVDGEETLKTLEKSDTVNRLAAVKEGASVSISLKDVDDAGNESGWSDTLSFIAKDTLPPVTPGKVGAKLVLEVDDVIAEPAPAPAPPVVEPEPEPPVEVAPVVEDTLPSGTHQE